MVTKPLWFKNLLGFPDTILAKCFLMVENGEVVCTNATGKCLPVSTTRALIFGTSEIDFGNMCALYNKCTAFGKELFANLTKLPEKEKEQWLNHLNRGALVWTVLACSLAPLFVLGGHQSTTR